VTLPVVAWSALALTALSVVFVLLLALRRFALAKEARRHLAAEERLRPVALALASGEADPSCTLDVRDAEIVAGLLGRYVRQLRGQARADIATFFEQRGFVEREVAKLGNRRSWKRARAAHLLGDMGSARAASSLLAALRHDSKREVRAAAARSLGTLQCVEAVEPLVDALVHGRVPRAVAGQALLTIGSASRDRLRGLVPHPAPEVRAAAVELLGLVGDASDAPLVAAHLRDSAAEVRAKASRALGRLGAEEEGENLRQALGDRIPFVRATAAIALGMLGDRASGQALLEQARADQFDPAHAAAYALVGADPALLWDSARRLGQGPHVAEAADVTAVNRTRVAR
jgi:HEAT repeat protein